MAKRKTKTTTRTVPWDSAAHLKSAEDIRQYLKAVFEDGDPALISHALGVVARAKGVSKIESLYKALLAAAPLDGVDLRRARGRARRLDL